MKKVIGKIKKLKDVKFNWFSFGLGFFIVCLVLISYFYVGDIDTSKTALEETNSVSIFGWEIDFASTSLFFASMIIGLLDGFNPCAMWVLIYLISLANSIGDRRKMFTIIGLFVVTEAVMYFIVLAGWLNMFMFIGISKWILYVVGAFAIYTGVSSCYSYYKSGGVAECEVGDLKSKKRTMKKIDYIIHSPITIASLGAVIALAVVVNAIEFVCSAGLPAIFSQMLAIANVSVVEKYFYIFIYDLFFMIDDFIVFGLAAWALSSDWMGKYSGFSKLVGGIIMFGIGIMLLFFPNVLL